MKVFSGSASVSPTQATELVQKQYADVNGVGGVFAGSTMQFAGASAPSGWLICDGSEVDRTTYAALFAAISTLHGVGNGSSTFNLPDLRRRIPVGKGSTGNIGDNDGVAVGSRGLTHTHTLPAHNHGMGSGADLNITASGSVTINSSTTGISTQSTNTDHTHPLAGSGAGTTTDGSHSHSISDPGHIHECNTTANPGSGNGTLPWQAGIRSDYRGDAASTVYPMGINVAATSPGLSMNANGSHSHSLTGNTQGMSATTHSHSISDPTHTHSVPNHTHATGNFSGRVGLVTGGVDGNAAMTSGSQGTTNYIILHHIIKT